VAHRTARLNQFGRQLLIERVLGEGWTVATAAEAQGSVARPATSGCDGIGSPGYRASKSCPVPGAW
jgi:hypothetical protein